MASYFPAPARTFIKSKKSDSAFGFAVRKEYGPGDYNEGFIGGGWKMSHVLYLLVRYEALN